MPIFLNNPKHKRREKMARSKRGVPAWVKAKGFSTWKSYMASIRKQKGGEQMAKRKKKKGVSKRSHKKRSFSSNPPSHRRHKRRYRPNPPVSMKGFIPMLMEGVIDAGEIVAGKAAARLIPALFGFQRGTMMNMIGQGATAVAIGYLGHSFISRNAGKMLLAGGLASPVEDIIKTLNIPMISAALGEDVDLIASYPGDDYAEIGEDDELASYPMGEEEEDGVLANY
jgi:hypothetical protein